LKRPDTTSAKFYAAAYLVRSGRARELYLYNSQKQVQDEFISMQAQALPFVSPAYEALLLSPLARFKFRTAYLIFLGVNLISLGFASLCSGRGCHICERVSMATSCDFPRILADRGRVD